jgi:tetratricopeptide (TPR) repeat protein
VEEGLQLLEYAYPKVRPQPALSWVGEQLLDTYLAAGRTTEAIQLVPELLTAARETLPRESPPLAGVLAAKGLTLLRCRAWNEAEVLLREALAIRQQHEPDAWTTCNTQSMLGEALAGQQKYAEAEPLLEQGYEGLQQRDAQIPPQGQSRLAEAVERLIAFHEAIGKPEEAARWRQELESRTAKLKTDMASQ